MAVWRHRDHRPWIGWFYVNANLLKRLTRISRTMTALAAGDTGQALDDPMARTRFADMARAVAGVHAENEIGGACAWRARARLNARGARGPWAKTIETLIKDFEDTSSRALEAGVSRCRRDGDGGQLR